MRAAIVRAELAVITAIFERTPKSGDIASFGYIFAELKDLQVRGVLLSDRGSQRWTPSPSKLTQAQRLYRRLDQSDELDRVRHLRHRAVGHLMRGRSKGDEVFNVELFALQDHAERLGVLLFAGLGFGEPDYASCRQELMLDAMRFWDAYCRGVGRAP